MKTRKTWRDNHGNTMEATIDGKIVSIVNLTDGTKVPPYEAPTEEEAQDFYGQLPG